MVYVRKQKRSVKAFGEKVSFILKSEEGKGEIRMELGPPKEKRDNGYRKSPLEELEVKVFSIEKEMKKVLNKLERLDKPVHICKCKKCTKLLKTKIESTNKIQRTYNLIFFISFFLMICCSLVTVICLLFCLN